MDQCCGAAWYFCCLVHSSTDNALFTLPDIHCPTLMHRGTGPHPTGCLEFPVSLFVFQEDVGTDRHSIPMNNCFRNFDRNRLYFICSISIPHQLLYFYIFLHVQFILNVVLCVWWS
ncbi:hypothetical protein Y032_0118g719 [Ancylostoma ceylanicum]|uniref:Uncharacterized protein n=1 Tax=Ancylostoma ceylanicum TaxID=53326 RepID=A0A016TBH3_9BILA|nr:hypothetical protein Y032_0118g719 [Ancylostoma ceylanicum]